MCGISVIIDPKNKRVHDTELKAMNNFIRHRGPDGEGFYFDDHFALGHRMLKITDFSIHGRQPMAYRQYVIVLNGEIYNYKDLRNTLKEKGYQFQTSTDTEVVMAAYDQWGTDCVHHFVGMWSFVLFDRDKQFLFCSRDRFGIKPFFYAQLSDKFVIGSEIKQLKAFAEFTPKLNQVIAFDYLYNGKIESVKDSFFEGVHFLPGGHHLIYDLKTHSFFVTQWYNIHKIEKSKKTSFAKAAGIFNELFTESVLSQSAAKLPVGACLSGGLDSTSIVGVTDRINTKVTTFSSCYTKHGINEIAYINSAVMHYDVENFKNYPNIHEMVENNLLRKIVYYQDQPILSGSFFSEYKVFETAAANNVRIVLSGQGADEYLGGYGEFTLLNLRGLLKKGKLISLARALSATARNQSFSLKQMVKSFIIFGLRIPYFNKKTASQSKAEAVNCLNNKWISEHMAQSSKDINLAWYNSLSKLSIEALVKYSLPHQLHSEDRNSMLYSIESRLPFLDHRVVEYCLGLPDHYIIRNGTTKFILRESLKEVLPPDIYNRHVKLGFPGPEESLFVNNYDYIHKEFSDYIQHFPDIFSIGLLNLLENYHLHKTPYSNLLFRVLSFGTWAREFGLMPATIAKQAKKAAVNAGGRF